MYYLAGILFIFNLSLLVIYFISGKLYYYRTVGVQGDCRTYSYVAALSSNDKPSKYWKDLMFIAKIIPRLSNLINRLVTESRKVLAGGKFNFIKLSSSLIKLPG